MPKSAIIISDEGPWYRKSPSLFKKKPLLRPKTLAEDREGE